MKSCTLCGTISHDHIKIEEGKEDRSSMKGLPIAKSSSAPADAIATITTSGSPSGQVRRGKALQQVKIIPWRQVRIVPLFFHDMLRHFNHL